MAVSFTLTKEAPAGVVHVAGVSPDTVADHPAHAFLADTDFAAKAGEHRVLPADGGGVSVVVGLGPDDERTAHTYRLVGGAVARGGAKHEAVSTDVFDSVGEVDAVAAAQAFAEGVGLGRYRYTALKSEPETSNLAEVHVVGKGGKRVQAALDAGASVAEAVCVTRDLVNEPGGTLTPPAFADQITRLGGTYGFDVTVLDEDAIAEAGMGGLVGVNRGSDLPARFVELRWTPGGKPRGAVALVGKGVTFDSGGLSLKPSDSMLTMKGDMAGAAAVVGVFCALGAVQPRVEVRGYVPLTDNMTGGDATRLGDVLRISNGKTVEVHNTDAEGRLILADALARASAEAPDAIVDLATLTGACMVALGETHAGVMGRNEAWLDQVRQAADAAGEPVWPLPLPEDWRAKLDSDVADMKNVGGRWGGASIAGLFLREFVGEGIPWAHIDIAGPAFVDTESPTNPKGATGYGVRTVLALLKAYRKPR